MPLNIQGLPKAPLPTITASQEVSRKHFYCILRLPDIAIANYRNFNGFFNFRDNFPVGQTTVTLIGRAGVNGNCIGSAIFRDAGNLHRIN